MTIFIIVLFCLCLEYILGVTHATNSAHDESLVATTLISLAICIALLIPLVYQVGRWAGFWEVISS